MRIKIWQVNTKNRNSTKQPTGTPFEADVVLKDETSIYAPVFELKSTYTSIQYVQWEGRFYFITNIVYVTNDIIRIYCDFDFMATYKTQIGLSEQFVTRSYVAGEKTPLIQDEMAVPLGTRHIDSVVPDTAVFNLNSGVYCIGFSTVSSSDEVGSSIPGAATVGSVQYVLMTQNEIDALNYVLQNQVIASLVNPLQYIVSCVYIPFTVTLSSQLTYNIKMGLVTIPIIYYALGATYRKATHFFTDVPQNQFAGVGRNYMHYAPFFDMVLYAGPFGSIHIPPEFFPYTNRYISYTIFIDYATGKGQLYIYSGKDEIADKLINIIDGQVGIPVQLNQISNGISLSNVAALGSSVLSGSAVSTIGGAGGALVGAAGIINSVENMTKETVSARGSNGSFIDFMGDPFTLSGYYYDAFNFDRRDFGVPFCDFVRISTLSGYVKTADANLEGINIPINIKDEIAAVMNSGFFYE